MSSSVLSHPPADEAALVARLRARDERAFAGLVEHYHGSLKRVARSYVSTDAVAEEVVQETWLAVIAGLDRFEGRSSLKTWIFHILANQAKRRGERERRVTFRDVEGFSAEEVCDLLGLTPGNQRVILHRARSSVRAALEGYMAQDGD